ncbi:penicillin-binding transpeptidase domain-containing protein [Paenibacillus chondroitinus]|uniref:Penicillin-binding transpeptidase domain-containing protein n=1 Tax=Paenibacillus chondroitinus TaxID=59842 RepID=A0ABU6DCZ9_9BACL|nr:MULTISPECIES: penicillin-binding transpeptidase domain-containing protein [Paenibacillus]MCY9661113.1 penicillin-binding transpeptidase domain-containing protein [Paenibacillus anseongense]MEB4794766.1 penicillin-binding transpeptidase domain-containing protein [Paenibacillus chondroitinus]
MRVKQLSSHEKRRIFLVLLTIVLLFIGIMGKLFWIQIAATENYSSHGVNLLKNSVVQRQRALVLESGRGEILDRNLQPMTGKIVKSLVVFPINNDLQASPQQVSQLVGILRTNAESWRVFTKDLKEPQVWSQASGGKPVALTDGQEEQIDALNLPNVKVVQMEDRYPTGMTARQLIGFIGQNPDRVMNLYGADLEKGKVALTTKIGGAGLEKTFDLWLRGIGETSISYFMDAGKRPLTGLDARMIAPNNAFYPVKLVTTLDVNVQQQIEALMDKLKIRDGAAVVQEVAQGDIVAMASRPNYDPTSVDLASKSWSNYALKATAPGSIFKTVVAAAALDLGVVNPKETFTCEGALGKYGFTCWRKEGHGPLTLEQGFAQSCNIVFAKVMQRLTAGQLESFAHKLGVLDEVGWTGKTDTKILLHQLDSEETGQLFGAHTPHDDEGILMQTAIGQRDVMMTPLQASNMVVTLLHNGKGYSPRVVQEIRYQTDRVMEKFEPQTRKDEEGYVSAATSRTLLSWMREVVTEGTGQGLKDAKWQLAGKSGTAQTMVGKQEKVNQWFIGYGPVASPKYAVSVVIKNTDPTESNKAIPLFKGIMDILASQSNSRQ